MLRDPSGVVQERWYGGRQDALIQGQNIELTNELTLARAPGSTAYSTATFPQAVKSFYSFKQFTGNSESITLMVDTPSVVYSLNPTAKTTVLTKANGAGPAFFIGIGNTLYIGDGAEQKAWNAIGSVRNWGIARYQGSSSSAAYAGAAANVASGYGQAWANPGNATGAPDAAYATTGTIGAFTISDYLQLTSYPITITGTPNGLQVDITLFNAPNSALVNVQLLLNGSLVGTPKTIALSALSPITVIVGGPGDLWGANLSAAQISANSANFGIAVWNAAGGTISGPAVSVDAAQITAFQTGPVPVTLVAGGFSPAPSTGFQYVAAYGNSGSPVGQASPPTAIIKPDATHSVQITLVASTDPQANQIWVFRTRDGGSTYENLPSSPYPNTSGNVTDSAPDATLNLFQLADLNGLNTPPPSGFTAFEFHLGRIWGAVGNTVYYSVGTDLGSIVGSAYEGFPPANFFTFPSAVVRLFSIGTVDGAVLIVFTTSDVYVILGNASAATVLAGATGLTVFYPAPLLRGIGLANYNAIAVRGSIVYMMTNDGRVVSFNPSSQIVYLDPEKAINEIGFPIGNAISSSVPSLALFPPASSYVTWHSSGSADQALYVADGSTGWFRCNPNTQPDGGAVWSTKRNIVGGCQAVQSIETAPGVFKLLIGPSGVNGKVLYRDPTVFSDNGVAYGNCKTQMGAIVLAQPGQVAIPKFITADFIATGSQPSLSVIYDDFDSFPQVVLTKTDNDPPHLPAPANDLYSNRYAMRQATSGVQTPNVCRWLLLTIDFGGADTVKNEMLSLTIFGEYDAQA